MDIFLPLALCVIFLIIVSLCGCLCKRKREGTVYGYGPSVTVTSQPVQSSAVVSPPYPVEARHPTPLAGGGPPAPGFATQPTPYPTNTPYGQPQPVAWCYFFSQQQPGYSPWISLPLTCHSYQPTRGVAPYPPPAGGTPYPPVGGAPYPPATNDYNSRPPPYDVAVSTPPVLPPPAKEVYGKQSPYNPNFS